jgi:predicted Ser/Thr protein kinase
MNQAQWERLKDIFQAALEQPASARREWLRAQCADDVSVLREAEALLDIHETAGDFLAQSAQIDPADLETLPPGSRVGNYVVLEELGRGGMGVVYLAEDQRLGRRVALKSLPASVASAPELRQRLRREARAAATISHPGVAVVYALEEVDDHLFIASEYVTGETLRAAILRGPIAAERVRAIAVDIAGALAAAHEAGVIHRDLKPENVLVKPDGSIKIVDFGIAQIEGPDATRLTRTGAMLGTPAYMAPEQLLGGQVDVRADIYAVGILLSEMLTGRHPLRADRTPMPHDASIGHLTGAIARCVQADPSLRFASARDLLAALGGEPPATAAQDPRPATVTQGAHRRFWWEFHQGVTALVYAFVAVPAWYARGLIGGWQGRTFFIAFIASVVVASIARLHLWFTSRFYPEQLEWVHRRSSVWIRIADWAFAVTLAAAGILIRDEHSPLTIVLPSVAIGAVVAFLLIEPVTAKGSGVDFS